MDVSKGRDKHISNELHKIMMALKVIPTNRDLNRHELIAEAIDIYYSQRGVK